MMAEGKLKVKTMVPKRLKEARIMSGLSQEKFAQLAGLNSKSQISNYESGRRVASFSFIARLAAALNYPEAYFYTIDDDFAKSLLEFYRNKNNPDFNPYITELQATKKMLADAQKQAESLAEFLRTGRDK